MSIYSGFANRAQERMYNGILERTLGFVAKRCYLFYRGQECSNEVKWA